MNMRKLLLALAMVVLALPLAAQVKPSQKDYLDRYNLLVSKLGVAGVGIETHLQKWEKDYPDDLDMLLGKFTYYYTKSRSESIEQKEGNRYLGEAPSLSLKDSLGNDVNYFIISSFDDELFGKATQAIDKAIELNQNRLDLRAFKISALLDYEKDSPDMALETLRSLIDYDGHGHPTWEYPGLVSDKDLFPAVMQDCCFAFYKIGTPTSYEAFKELSERMLSYYPDAIQYMTNIGSYYLVYKKDSKNALKMYNKVLKKHPDDYATIKNCVLLARNDKNAKLEKKYLPMLIKVTPDEMEKASAQARLSAL
jgi:tetratricopeptide (TPR) repeat protein